MREQTKGPRRGADRHGPERKTLGDEIIENCFPVCKLLGVRVVDRFPENCPLGGVDSLGEILALQDGAYDRLAPGVDEDYSGGLADHARARTCYQCVTVLSCHSQIRQLKAETTAPVGEVARATETPATAPAFKVQIRARRGRAVLS